MVMSIQYEAYPTFSYQVLTIISTFTLPAPPGEVNHNLVKRELLTLESVRLTWVQPDDNNGHITSYNLTYCAVHNSYCIQHTINQTFSTTEIATFSPLIPLRTYQVYIRAVNDVGQGPEPLEPYLLQSVTKGIYFLIVLVSFPKLLIILLSSWFVFTVVESQVVGLNVVFVSATSVVLAWQLPTIAESAGVHFFLLSYNLQELDSEGNTTHRELPNRRIMTLMVPYQQATTPGAAVSGLDSDALYEFQVSVNYSDPVLLSAKAIVTVHTNPSGMFNGLE